MKANQIYVGIDVSKEHLDFSVFTAHDLQKNYLERCSNTHASIKKMLAFIKKKHPNQPLLICMEATGYYSEFVADFLHENNYQVWVENPLRIKNSLGLGRGKNDKVDSGRIAEYAYRHEDKFCAYVPASMQIRKLKRLQRIRTNLKKSLNIVNTHVNEAKKYLSAEEYELLSTSCEASREALENDLKSVTQVLEKAVKEDKEIKKNYDILVSVPGVGLITAVELIIATRNFTTFDNARALACYCGVAPFEHSSGKFTGKSRTSRLGNMRLKSLLHMCAVSLLNRKNCVFARFYKKKTDEGKKKRVAINALRNKLLHTIFACVSKGEKYDPKHQNKTKDEQKVAEKADSQTENLVKPVSKPCRTSNKPEKSITDEVKDVTEKTVKPVSKPCRTSNKPEKSITVESSTQAQDDTFATKSNNIVEFAMAKKTHRGSGLKNTK